MYVCICMHNLITLQFGVLWGFLVHTYSVFPGQGWNSRHSGNPSHNSDNSESLMGRTPGSSHCWLFKREKCGPPQCYSVKIMGIHYRADLIIGVLTPSSDLLSCNLYAHFT